MILFTRALCGLEREKYPLETWIDAGEREAALDPDFPIVDAHHHMWDARTQDKGWPVSKFMIRVLYALNPGIMQKIFVKKQDPRMVEVFSEKLPFAVPYMANNMLRDIENIEQGPRPLPSRIPMKESFPGHNVVATVYIESGWADPKARSEAIKAVPEIGMAQAVASSSNNRLCTGIVGHVPLLEGAEEVRPALATMVEQFPNMRGIRDSLAFREGYLPINADKDMAYDAKFRSAFSLLSEFNLTYETWLYHDNIPALRDLALAFPETTIICDHMGSPSSIGLIPPSDTKTIFQDWASSIKELADRCPNVVVKLSGLGMPIYGFGFDRRPAPPSSAELAKAWRPYVLHCIECFGVDRCMFASNFPVDKVSCSYTALFNSFKIIVKDFSIEDKKKLFHDNAVRVYRLQIKK